MSPSASNTLGPTIPQPEEEPQSEESSARSFLSPKQILSPKNPQPEVFVSPKRPQPATETDGSPEGVPSASIFSASFMASSMRVSTI